MNHKNNPLAGQQLTRAIGPQGLIGSMGSVGPSPGISYGSTSSASYSEPPEFVYLDLETYWDSEYQLGKLTLE